ncbi:hypothetical protein [Methanoplanus endosymbiosus]|uniref:Lipoprotein n=1 Tax=Methanoplanus endosymbiosus TaxID=33865 RepID=A0A9E7PT22_9EURY|nr:hypothetical protein [Methanoplanus endosymbiosus]UUX93322.1 hypothetical protein L6E24_04130 [Methanoplanus endosymbiosus]
MVLINSKLKFFSVLLLLIACFALSAGCTGENPAVMPDPDSVTVSGTGSKKTGMSLNDGTYLLTKDFSEDYDAVPLPYQDGEYDGTVTAKIEKSNNYLLNINCDRKWNISVKKA